MFVRITTSKQFGRLHSYPRSINKRTHAFALEKEKRIPFTIHDRKTRIKKIEAPILIHSNDIYIYDISTHIFSNQLFLFSHYVFYVFVMLCVLFYCFAMICNRYLFGLQKDLVGGTLHSELWDWGNIKELALSVQKIIWAGQLLICLYVEHIYILYIYIYIRF